MDELLNLQWLEQTGERPKGVDGFYKSDDDAPLSKRQGRKKKKKSAKVANSKSAVPATASEGSPHDGVDADHFEKPAYIKYNVPYSTATSGLELESEHTQTNSKSSWNNAATSSSRLPSGQHLRVTPTSLQEAGATKAALAASARHSYASASSAYKKGKSDPLMRQVAAFYTDRGRTEATSHRQAVSAEASLIVDQQSTGDVVDLHGVSVQDGVDIAIDRVWGWWNSLGENKVRKARANGLEVVTGLGRHSSDGKSRLRINVIKALVADGWKVQVLTGSCLVTGRA